MTDAFEEQLLKTIQDFETKISECEQRIMSDQQLIEGYEASKITFRTLFESYKIKLDRDRTAEEAKYKSDIKSATDFLKSSRSFAETLEFYEEIGIEITEEIKQFSEEEEEKEGIKEAS